MRLATLTGGAAAAMRIITGYRAAGRGANGCSRKVPIKNARRRAVGDRISSACPSVGAAPRFLLLGRPRLEVGGDGFHVADRKAVRDDFHHRTFGSFICSLKHVKLLDEIVRVLVGYAREFFFALPLR